MAVTDLRLILLEKQLDMIWGFAKSFIVDQVDLSTALWEPSDNVCTVHRSDCGWVADWPDEETGKLPDATIAWLLWHIEWWLNDTVALVSGQARLPAAKHVWSGSTSGIVLAKATWDKVLVEIDLDTDIDWHTPNAQPLWAVAGWVNFELSKNLAEINQLQILHANSC